MRSVASFWHHLKRGSRKNSQTLSKMKQSTLVIAVFWIGTLLVGANCRPTQEQKLWTLDQAKNRELFLSALQSYFSNRGLQVDLSAPVFSTFPAKDMQTLQALLGNVNNKGLDRDK